MKLLALDLSTKSSGWAFGEDQKLESFGCLTAKAKDVEKRIIQMRQAISNLILNNKPDKVIMQQVRPQVNSHTNKVLMWLQAIVVIALYEIDPKIQVQFVGASEWRAIIKIKQGRSIKRDQVKLYDIQYVKNKYNLTVNDDTADAICIFDSYWIKNDNELNWE